MKFFGMCFLLFTFSLFFANLKVLASINDQPYLLIAAKDSPDLQNPEIDFFCDGIHDQAEINYAFKMKKVVVLLDGTYNIENTIIGDNNILRGQGNQTILKLSNNIELGISIGGSQKLLEITNPIMKGDSYINTINNLSNHLQTGDFVCLTSEDTFNGLRGYYWNGELIQIHSVSNHSLTFKKETYYNYTKSPRIIKYNFVDSVGIEDLKIINGNASSIVADIHEARNSFYKNVYVDGNNFAKQGLRTSNCLQFSYDDCIVANVQDSRNTNFPQGYGYYLFGVVDAEVKESKGKNNKHSVDLGGYRYAPVTRNITISNFIAENDRLESFSTHGSAYKVRWINCQSYESGGGFLIRSANNEIIRPVVKTSRKCGYAMRFGEFTQQGGHWNKFDGNGGKDLFIMDAKIELSGNGSNRYFYFSDPIDNVLISGGNFSGNHAEVLYFKGLKCNNLKITHSNFEICNQSEDKSIFVFEKVDIPIFQVEINNVDFYGYDDQLVIKSSFENSAILENINFYSACP